MTAPAKRIEPGRSRAAVAKRRKMFVERYLVNGNNATEAAKFVGFSDKTATQEGHRMLHRPEIAALLAKRAERVVEIAQLTTERWAREMAAIGHFDPGELYDEAGNLIPIHLLPEHVRRAIAGVKLTSGGTEYKFCDKNPALANIGKHLGMFESDNRQRASAIQVNVILRG